MQEIKKKKKKDPYEDYRIGDPDTELFASIVYVTAIIAVVVVLFWMATH